MESVIIRHFESFRSEVPADAAQQHVQLRLRARIRAERCAVLLGGVVPVVLLFVAPTSAAALMLALLAHVAGMFVERWLFFAEAKHVVTLYYEGAA